MQLQNKLLAQSQNLILQKKRTRYKYRAKIEKRKRIKKIN